MKLHGNCMGGGRWQKKEELNNPGATEIEYWKRPCFCCYNYCLKHGETGFFYFQERNILLLTPNIYECGFQQKSVLKWYFRYVHASYSNITLNFRVAGPEM